MTTHEHPFFVAPNKEGSQTAGQGKWVPAAELKVGMDLQTCSGTPVQVQKWDLIEKPFTAWNIEVAHSHTYYVTDPINPNAPPVLVHNACDIRWGPNAQKKFKKHAQDIYSTARKTVLQSIRVIGKPLEDT
ncbi:polymorphic toxin-type HINT domain-containing protein [Polycladidibacter stylochi]|uniref:polymorphic toxin-type HINT domain-containing protein n=1 Tax=Polycladidibacter stylochi TaxID=1807766 RepID=UPI003B75C49A